MVLSLGPEEERGALRYRGSPSVGVGIVRQSKSNVLRVAQTVKDELPVRCAAQVGQQGLVRADRRIDAAGMAQAVLPHHLVVEGFAHAVQALELIVRHAKPSRMDMDRGQRQRRPRGGAIAGDMGIEAAFEQDDRECYAADQECGGGIGEFDPADPVLAGG